MSRPTMDHLMMSFAHLVARRSTCQRAAVGVVVTNADKTNVVAYGYNGNARGLANGCDAPDQTPCGCLHAEENALIKAPHDRGNLILYSTHAPCAACAKRIINSRVVEVYYADPYKYAATSLLLLRQAGVRCVESH